jgi:hypothetical protein
MTFGEKWPLLDDYGLHPIGFELIASSLNRDRLVNDILKCLGDLDSILNLPSTSMILGIANIRERKLSRSATSRLGKVQNMFRVKSDNINIADTSRR